jgi:hypothetical protein
MKGRHIVSVRLWRVHPWWRMIEGQIGAWKCRVDAVQSEVLFEALRASEKFEHRSLQRETIAMQHNSVAHNYE